MERLRSGGSATSDGISERFKDYCWRREQATLKVHIPGYVTREDTQPIDVVDSGEPRRR